MPSKSEGSKKVMDVSKASAPSETSRPVIVTNRRIVQDPMMKPDEEPKSDNDSTQKEESGPSKPTSMASTGKTLQPLSAQDKPDDTSAEEVEISSDKPVEIKTETENPEDKTYASETVDTSKQDEEDESAREAKEEAAIVDAVANQANKKKKDEDVRTDSAKQEAIDKLIADKKYFLPIGQITKRKHNQQVAAIVAFMLITLVGGYIVLDMELIETPVELPFRFFNGR